MCVGKPAQAGQELWVGRDESRVADDRLDDDRRHDVLAQRPLDRFEIVERRCNRKRRKRVGHARRIRQPKRRDARSGTHEKGVRVTMVAAIELYDYVATGHRTCKTHRGHRRLGATRHKAEHLHVRHATDDPLGQHQLERRRNSEARAAAHRVGKRVEHDRRRVSENERTPRQHVVDVLATVDVPDVRARAALDDEWLAADAAERADGRIHSARKERPRALHDLVRPAHRPKLPMLPLSTGSARDTRGAVVAGAETTRTNDAAKS